MIKPKDFIENLTSLNLSLFLMVPCSIFKPLASFMLNSEVKIIFPPNEAHAMGFAVGSYSVTSTPAVIFIQNSGLNNIANCQTSLNLLYKIPVLFVVSWRGEKKDAPEHKIMGENLKQFLDTLQIPFTVLSENWRKEIKEMVNLSKKKKMPTALVVKEGTFEKGDFPTPDLTDKYSLSRLEAIKIIKDSLKKKAVFISTTGFTSRDSFAVSDTPDFYMMGSMGHAFSIGAGATWSLTKKDSDLRVIIFDGDGGCLMHLGSLALVNLEKIKKGNLIYILFDNEAYESTGNQPSLSPKLNFVKIAEGLGFPQCFFVTKAEELKKIINELEPNLAAFIHIKINRKRIEETARVSDKYSCEQIAERFRENF